MNINNLRPDQIASDLARLHTNSTRIYFDLLGFVLYFSFSVYIGYRAISVARLVEPNAASAAFIIRTLAVSNLIVTSALFALYWLVRKTITRTADLFSTTFYVAIGVIGGASIYSTIIATFALGGKFLR